MTRRPPRSPLFPCTDALPICIISQPDWQSAEPFRALGKPRVFFGVTGDRESTRLNSSHTDISPLPSSFFNDTAPTEISPLPLHRRSSDLYHFAARLAVGRALPGARQAARLLRRHR